MVNYTNKGKGSPWVWLTPLIILAVSLVAALIAYPFLPAQIPIHFGLNGANNYAGKWFIFVIAFLPAVLYLLFKAKYGKR